MSNVKNFLRGVGTKLFFGVMPESLLDPSIPLAAPPDATITTTAAIVVGDDTVDIAVLTAPVAAGSAILLTTGAAPNFTAKALVYTIADANIGDNELQILPAEEPIATGATAAHKGLILLKGGTNSQEQINNQGQQISIYQDGTGLAYQDGIVTSASWAASYNFNALPDDLGYYRLKYCAVNAINGARGYLRMIDPPAPGFAKGESIEGLVDIEGWNVDKPADGIINGSLNFAGRGAPLPKPASKVA
jgi:hypothetical protein